MFRRSPIKSLISLVSNGVLAFYTGVIFYHMVILGKTIDPLILPMATGVLCANCIFLAGKLYRLAKSAN